MKGNVVIGQSGGPTSVINASLYGVIQGCLQQTSPGKIYGMSFGIQGFLEEKLLDLGSLSSACLGRLKDTPGSALGSCRHKVQEEDLPRILEVLQKFDIRRFFLIGGNDTMDTIHRVEAFCRTNAYEMVGIGIPKTVDNDLFGTDHTPGFPSAARYVALSVLQEGLLARDMKRVDQFVIYQTIGRSAGWLAAAAALARKKEGDPPHLILLPERPFLRDRFLADVRRCYQEHGFVSIVCGEGIVDPDGRPVSASEVTDKFSNIEFGAMAGTGAAMVLHQILTKEFGWRGEFEITESLQMCAADRVAPTDGEEAMACGRRAAELAAKGQSGVMVSLVRESSHPYRCSLGEVSLKEVAVHAKPMPDSFIHPDGSDVTPGFIEYARPLIGAMPDYLRLPHR